MPSTGSSGRARSRPLLEPRARKAIARLVTSVLSVKPVAEGLGMPLRVVPVARDTAVPRAHWSARQWGELDRLLDRVARQAGVAGLTLPPNVALDDLQVFERVVSNRLALAELADSVTAIPEDLLEEVDQVAAATLADSFDVFFQKESTLSPDGLPLNTYSAGPGGEAVVVVPACGMPAALAES